MNDTTKRQQAKARRERNELIASEVDKWLIYNDVGCVGEMAEIDKLGALRHIFAVARGRESR